MWDRTDANDPILYVIARGAMGRRLKNCNLGEQRTPQGVRWRIISEETYAEASPAGSLSDIQRVIQAAVSEGVTDIFGILPEDIRFSWREPGRNAYDLQVT